jgi:OOP family OmpA-OmpF porin
MRRGWLIGPWLALTACATTVTRTAPPTLLATSVAATEANRDFDTDGFPDPADRCPAVTGVAPHGCPDPDSDGDGFLDSQDRCPAEPGVEPDGCPIPDTDGDTILDPDDRCPTALETRNGVADRDGCPDEIPADLASITGRIDRLQFDLDRDTIKPKSFAALDRIVTVLAHHPDIRIMLVGHVDSTGNMYRSELSGRRARAVKHYFIDHGIHADRLETRGAGPDEPVDTNKTTAGRAKNRRVELQITVDPSKVQS